MSTFRLKQNVRSCCGAPCQFGGAVDREAQHPQLAGAESLGVQAPNSDCPDAAILHFAT